MIGYSRLLWNTGSGYQSLQCLIIEGLNIDMIGSEFLSVMLHFQMGRFKISGFLGLRLKSPLLPTPTYTPKMKKTRLY